MPEWRDKRWTELMGGLRKNGGIVMFELKYPNIEETENDG